MRSQALLKLNRRGEASESVDTLLSQNPDDSMSHNTAAWNYFEQGYRKKALHHFGEALRLDPNNEGARSGLINVIKADNMVFRALMNYFFWMSRLSGWARWSVILGAYFGYRILFSMTKDNPGLMPVAVAVGVTYVLFIFLTWAGDSLFNLLLFCHPQGRHALSKRERNFAMSIGACVLGALCLGTIFACVAFELLAEKPYGFACFIAAILLFFHTIPLGKASRLEYQRNRRVMLLFNTCFGVLILASFVLEVFGNTLGFKLYFVGILSVCLFSWFSGLVLKSEN